MSEKLHRLVGSLGTQNFSNKEFSLTVTFLVKKLVIPKIDFGLFASRIDFNALSKEEFSKYASILPNYERDLFIFLRNTHIQKHNP